MERENYSLSGFWNNRPAQTQARTETAFESRSLNARFSERARSFESEGRTETAVAEPDIADRARALIQPPKHIPETQRATKGEAYKYFYNREFEPEPLQQIVESYEKNAEPVQTIFKREYSTAKESPSFLSERAATTVRQPSYETEKPTYAPPETVYIERKEEYIMPSEHTMKYASVQTPDISFEKEPVVEAVHEESIEEKPRLSISGKALIAIYSAIIVILAALIITTGVFINNLNRDIAAAQSSIDYEFELKSFNSALLAEASNPDVIRAKASELNFTEPAGFVSIQAAPVKELPVYEPTTNWFDRFCDWLSSVIGG